jgi:hypothetical protein
VEAGRRARDAPPAIPATPATNIRSMSRLGRARSRDRQGSDGCGDHRRGDRSRPGHRSGSPQIAIASVLGDLPPLAALTATVGRFQEANEGEHARKRIVDLFGFRNSRDLTETGGASSRPKGSFGSRGKVTSTDTACGLWGRRDYRLRGQGVVPSVRPALGLLSMLRTCDNEPPFATRYCLRRVGGSVRELFWKDPRVL